METQKQITIVLVLLCCLCLFGIALAAPATTTLERYLIGSGGGHAESGIFSLEGSIGQAVVGVDSAAPLALCSGFWCGFSGADVELSYNQYLPLGMYQSAGGN